jgi:tRNA A37 threonylcarbamoyladenosine modification protein TsaB
MIKDFLILNCIGKNDKIGLKINNKFYIHDFDQKVNKNDFIVSNILNLIKRYKVNINDNFSILVNNGPGSFSSIRVSLAVAKGIKISKKINLFGYKNSDLAQFNLANIELLIKKKLLQKKLIKPLYIS